MAERKKNDFELTSEEEYKYRLEHRTEEELKLARKYGCNGLCFGNKFMCPLVDTCSHTGPKEFLGTLIATLFIGLIYLVVIVLPVIGLIYLFIKTAISFFGGA